MRVTVDGTEVELLPGMTVRHAILARYGTDDENLSVTDRWGNLVGFDGAVSDGAFLYTVRRTLTDQQ
jgi:hypothetical protein